MDSMVFARKSAPRPRSGRIPRAPVIIAASVLLAAAFALNAAAAAVGAGRAVYSNTRWLADNLKLTDTIFWNDDVGREESYSLELTGPGESRPIILADDTVYGSLTISQMTEYASRQGLNVLAAVNTDFFSLKTGVPLGAVVEDGEYISSPGDMSTVTFDYDGNVRFSNDVRVGITLTNMGGAENPANAGKYARLVNFNKGRADTGGLYLFSSAFSTVSTRTSTPGWFVKFKILEGFPTVSGSLSLVVTETLESDGALDIGDGYLVLTAADASGYIETYEMFAVGDTVTMTTQCNDENLAAAQWATGGGDIIISGGAVTNRDAWDKALLDRHPRTALGVKEDGSVIAYVLDGRDSTHSMGLTLAALAEEMLRLGCVDAVNFDGGGSSAMSVRLPGDAKCTVVNKPSDGAERKCGAYMLFVTDLAPDGVPSRLSVRNDGVIALRNARFGLEFTARDAGFMPAEAPGDVHAVSSGLGEIDGTWYTAGAEAGVDRLALHSPSTGASGSGEVYIINTPTSLTVTWEGAPPLSETGAITLWRGDSVRFSARSTYYRREVVSRPESYVYSVTGEIGEADASGVFTAAGGAAFASGKLTVSAGDRQSSVDIEVRGFEDVSGHWADTYIYDLAGKDIVSGVSKTLFMPDAPMKRGDFVLMLYRSAGSPVITGPGGEEDAAPEGAGVFSDVAPEDYYADAVAWAKSRGVADGRGGGIFAPADTLSRQEAFTLLYRAIPELTGDADPDAEAPDESVLEVFGDLGELAPYASLPAAGLVGMGIVEGAGGALRPNEALTRAQMAKVLSLVVGYENPAPDAR